MVTVVQYISGLWLMATLWMIEVPCYVTSVRGDVRLSGKLLRVGDTLSESRIRQINSPEGAYLTLFHPQKGSIRVYGRGIARESMVEYLAHMLKMKSKTVSLSSRATSCECIDYRECFETDTDINRHLLITDSLEFPVDRSQTQEGKSIYFLQWKQDGALRNRQLTVRGDKVVIRPLDIHFTPGELGLPVSEQISLVVARQVNGNVAYTILMKCYFSHMEQGELLSYWRVLREARPDLTAAALRDTLYRDVYMMYGKPDKCTIDFISNQ